METGSDARWKTGAHRAIKGANEQQRAVVRIGPSPEPWEPARPGALAHLLVHEVDLVSPLGESLWDAAT